MFGVMLYGEIVGSFMCFNVWMGCWSGVLVFVGFYYWFIFELF